MKIQLTASLLIASTAIVSSAMAESPFDGTWKADMATAQLSEKPRVFLIQGGMFTCTSCEPAFTIKADGSFYAVAGHLDYDEVALKVIDAASILESFKLHGKLISETTVVIASDGKTLTYRSIDHSTPQGPPTVYSGKNVRLAVGPAGAHVLSGSWKTEQGSVTGSDAALTMTLKVEGATVSMSQPTGYGYQAPIGGAPVPIKGDPLGSKAALTMTGPKTLVETDSVDGKVTYVSTMTVSADGSTIALVSDDVIHKTRDSFTFVKQ